MGDIAFVLAAGSTLLLPAFLAGLWFATGRAFARPAGGGPLPVLLTPRTAAGGAAERRRAVGG